MEGKLGKIIIVSIWEDMWSLGEGGGVPDELHFIRNLSDKGVDIHFLIPESASGQTRPEEPNTSYHTYPNIFRMMNGLPGSLKRLVLSLVFPRVVRKRLKRLVETVRPDVIVGFSHFTLSPVGGIGRQFGIPTAAKLFGVMYLACSGLSPLKYWWRNFDQILALRHGVDRYIVLNDGTKGETALLRRGIPREKISFLPNGMDTEWIAVTVDRNEERRRLGLPADDILVVTYSRLVASKRVDMFLEAASKIDPDLRKGVTFVIGGDGPERGRLERLARKLGLESKVKFTGIITYDEIVRFLKASDIFVGTNELTNMSMPPCEAILCGVPVVAFDVLGTSEVVQDDVTGLLAADGDTAELAKKMELLIADGERRKELGMQAAGFAREHFVSWDDRIGMEHEILEALVQRKPRERM